eukprot:XP_017453296.1 PREDICTED: uncharacterized protein C10orf95 homolog [Rattus norvegicus]
MGMSEVCARAGACVRFGEGARSEGASSDSAGLGPLPQPRLSAGETRVTGLSKERVRLFVGLAPPLTLSCPRHGGRTAVGCGKATRRPFPTLYSRAKAPRTAPPARPPGAAKPPARRPSPSRPADSGCRAAHLLQPQRPLRRLPPWTGRRPPPWHRAAAPPDGAAAVSPPSSPSSWPSPLPPARPPRSSSAAAVSSASSSPAAPGLSSWAVARDPAVATTTWRGAAAPAVRPG